MKKLGLATLLVITMSTVIAEEVPMTAQELGLMVGAPPPVEQRVTVENFLQPPYNRWSLQHLREVVPTRSVAPGNTVAELPVQAVDLSGLGARSRSATGLSPPIRMVLSCCTTAMSSTSGITTTRHRLLST